MNAWLFDIDGVITNHKTKKVENPQILEHILSKLQKGEPVGLVTGRKIPTAMEMVIKPLQQMSGHTDALDLLRFEGEFGAITLNFKDGKEEIDFDNNYTTPRELIEKGREIIENYKDSVFFDEKKSFYTAEMKTGGNIDKFKETQPKLAKELENLLIELNLIDEFEVHQDTVAINVKNKKLTKYLATDKFLNWLMEKNINPDFYYVFGDSESDFQMGEELKKNNKELLFVYTGIKQFGEFNFKIKKTDKHYDSGTLEFLKNN